MKIDVPLLTDEMLAAAKTVVGDRWPVLRQFAEIEFRALAVKLAEIQNLLATGAIDHNRARMHLRIQQNAAQSALRGSQGLGLLTAETVVQSVTASIAADVNGLLGFKLIVLQGEQPQAGTPMKNNVQPQPAGTTGANTNAKPNSKTEVKRPTRITTNPRVQSAAATATPDPEPATPDFKAGRDL
jgi:hypothetical protein